MKTKLMIIAALLTVAITPTIAWGQSYFNNVYSQNNIQTIRLALAIAIINSQQRNMAPFYNNTVRGPTSAVFNSFNGYTSFNNSSAYGWTWLCGSACGL